MCNIAVENDRTCDAITSVPREFRTPELMELYADSVVTLERLKKYK